MFSPAQCDTSALWHPLQQTLLIIPAELIQEQGKGSCFVHGGFPGVFTPWQRSHPAVNPD